MLFVCIQLLTGESYLEVGWPYGIWISTYYAIFNETHFDFKKCLPSIRFPQTEQEWKLNANLFRKLRNSPKCGVIAALEGLGIETQKPHLCDAPDLRKFYNRNGVFAVCVQAVVKRDYRFCFVSAMHSGGTHDGTAFSTTKLFQFLNGFTLPDWAAVIADDAYSNKCRVLSPYTGQGLTQKEKSFNAYLSSCRIIVEQAFGMFVSRLGVFWSAVRYPLTKVPLIILAACKPHNFIMDNADDKIFN